MVTCMFERPQDGKVRCHAIVAAMLDGRADRTRGRLDLIVNARVVWLHGSVFYCLFLWFNEEKKAGFEDETQVMRI